MIKSDLLTLQLTAPAYLNGRKQNEHHLDAQVRLELSCGRQGKRTIYLHIRKTSDMITQSRFFIIGQAVLFISLSLLQNVLRPGSSSFVALSSMVKHHSYDPTPFGLTVGEKTHPGGQALPLAS